MHGALGRSPLAGATFGQRGRSVAGRPQDHHPEDKVYPEDHEVEQEEERGEAHLAPPFGP